MSNFFKYLLRKKITIIVMAVVFLLIGFFLSRVKTYTDAYYIARFEITNGIELDEKKLTSKEYLEEIKRSGYNKETKVNKYENINVPKMLKNNDFTITDKGENVYEIKTAYKYYDIFFISSSKTLGTRAKMFIKDSVTTLAGKDNVIFNDPTNIVKLYNQASTFLWTIYSFLIGMVLMITILSILYYKNNNQMSYLEYDNEEIYRTIFHKSYFIKAFKAVSKTKDIAIIGVLFGMMIVCKLIPLPSGFGDLGISFTYIFFAIISLIYGPVYGFGIGILSDVIGYIIRPSGYFFIGYTLQAALSGMIYGFCLYKTKISYGKVLLSRILINMLMNVFLGSILYGIVFTNFKFLSKDFNEYVKSYAILVSLPKNLFYLLPQSLLLYFVIKRVSPVLNHFSLINEKIYQHIKVLE